MTIDWSCNLAMAFEDKQMRIKYSRKITIAVGSTVLAASIFMGIPGSASNAAANPPQGDIAAGGLAWTQYCTHCHNLRSPNELRDDQWKTSMFHMRVRAGLTGKETRDILSFIQAANATAARQRVSRAGNSGSVVEDSAAQDENE